MLYNKNSIAGNVVKITLPLEYSKRVMYNSILDLNSVKEQVRVPWTWFQPISYKITQYFRRENTSYNRGYFSRHLDWLSSLLIPSYKIPFQGGMSRGKKEKQLKNAVCSKGKSNTTCRF